MDSEFICSIQDLDLPMASLLSSQCLVAVKKGIRKLGIMNGIPYETECIMMLLLWVRVSAASWVLCGVLTILSQKAYSGMIKVQRMPNIFRNVEWFLFEIWIGQGVSCVETDVWSGEWHKCMKSWVSQLRGVHSLLIIWYSGYIAKLLDWGVWSRKSIFTQCTILIAYWDSTVAVEANNININQII